MNTFREFVKNNVSQSDLEDLLDDPQFLNMKIVGDYEQTSKLYDKHHNEIWQIFQQGLCPTENFKHLIVCEVVQTIVLQENE